MTIKTVTKAAATNKPTAAAATAVKPAVRRIKATSAVTPPKGKTLYFFHGTPRGDMLRVYTIAMIIAQCGAIRKDAPFRLWPGGNFNTHLQAKRLKRGTTKGTFVLTEAGVTHFAVEGKKPEKSELAAMLDAVKLGKKTDLHPNRQLALMS